MLDKLQKKFDEMRPGEVSSVEFEFHEVSLLLALVKANETYGKTIEGNMLKGFEKDGI